MSKPSVSLFFGFAILTLVCLSQAQKLAPALYVFGDSNVDAGNNNLLNVYAKANYAPYGVDFPSGVNGRPTNGFNFADFFATWLGLKVPPAFRLVNATDYNAISDGINYASSAAGILPETATDIFKGILCLDAQVGLFKKTVEEYLPPHFDSKESLATHLSKSIFVVAMGANDYGFTFMKQINSTNPLDYISSADLLLQKLSERLRDLYNLGARKFVVFDIEALGCQPSNVIKIKPASKCVNYLNEMVNLYNLKLPIKLEQLRLQLRGLSFVVARYYDFTLKLTLNPNLYGLKNSANTCCPILSFGVCDPKMPPCPDRNSHVFFDAFHITEASYKILASCCFSGVGSCFPINVKQLALL